MQTESPVDPRRSLFEGWQGVLLIAATYVYFLIYAQFGFLQRLARLGITADSLPIIMGAMAIGGIGISLVAPRTTLWSCPSCRLQTAFIGSALIALWSLLPLNTLPAVIVSFVIGLSLGLLTVTLVSNLPLWIGYHRPLLKIGAGTGIGYLVCNFPPLFTASPESITLTAVAFAVLGLVVANRSHLHYALHQPPQEHASSNPFPFALVLAWFTALVWLDSAAFFIIQNSPHLKAGTWQGDLHLWRTGALHLIAALFSGWLLARRGISVTLILAMGVLGSSCLLLLDPASFPVAAVLYPIGVSLYSVALIAFPSFLMNASSQTARARGAGYLYALAGWVGSAMGIGMAQNLHHVPPAFVAVAAALFVLPWVSGALPSLRLVAFRFDQSMQIQTLAVLIVGGTAFAILLIVRPPIQPFANPIVHTAVEHGRRVYIAEGCINCHSQYVRPNTADVLMWGPVTSIDVIRSQQPPLIGNRRQGPDLSQVGTRRSELWLRIHFMNPRDVSYDSVMPSFDYLFRNSRGEDLIAYLGSLNNPGHWSAVASWQPGPEAWQSGSLMDGGHLFAEHCATCHASQGRARLKWLASFQHLPPDLKHDPLNHIPAALPPDQFRTALARITKFGIQGTDMPGHEYLPDDQVAALAEYVASTRETQKR